MARKPQRKRKPTKEEEEEASTSSSEHRIDADVDVDGADDDGSEGERDTDSDQEDDMGQGGNEEESDRDASTNDEGSHCQSAQDQRSSDQESDEEQTDNDKNNDDDTPNNKEACTFSLPDLLSFNTHQINSASLYSTNNNTSSANNQYYNSATIPSSAIKVNEHLLLQKAIGGTAQLLKELWKLESERVEGGFVVAKLPKREGKAGLLLPRALPPPPQKQLTKWEKFALERGISPKSKRSRKQFDEATGTWKHLTGSLQNKANAGPASWPILEVKKNDDPTQDPWEKLRDEKKARVRKNTESRMRNAERGGLLEKGSANRAAKNLEKMEKQRQMSRESERKRGIVAPAGVPVDVKSGYGRGGSAAAAKRGKPSTQLALVAAQVSTASLGKFDKMREGEPERRLDRASGKKRKALVSDVGSSASKKKHGGMSAEADKSRDILSRVMNGSKGKDKDVKKGKYAKGETAYDYEFSDGLGAGTFKKKKGRAGVGKMRKVTKKRIK